MHKKELSGKANMLHAASRALSFKDWLGPGGDAMQAAGISLTNMRHVHSRIYQLQCNWKVFCDNYLVHSSPLSSAPSHIAPVSYLQASRPPQAVDLVIAPDCLPPIDSLSHAT